MLDNYLKYGLLLSFSLLTVSLAWLFFNYLKVFSLFPLISFLALLSYSIFIVRLYLNNLHESKLSWIHWLVISIISLPILMGVIQFFDTRFYENYWPVVIVLITIQSILGLMSVFGFFITRKATPTIVNIVVFCAGIYAVAWSFLVVSKSVINEVRNVSLFVLVALTAIIVLGNVLIYFRKGN